MHNPLFNAALKVRGRLALRRDGYSFRQINEILSGADQDTIDLAVAMTEVTKGALPSAGETPFLDWLRAFLDSDFGKLLIDILLKLLLGLL